VDWTEVADDNRPLRGLLAPPVGQGPWPGVIVIHDLFGISRDLRKQVEWLASEGFLTLAPDLFGEGLRAACLYRVFGDLRRRVGPTFDRIEAARSALVTRRDCTGAIGILGFCIGGDFALLLAAGRIYRVASVNYGSVPRDVEVLLGSSCPIVGSFGGLDRRLRGAADKLEQALIANGIDHDVQEYPSAGHAFMNKAGRVATTLTRATSAGHHEASAEHARLRITAFLRRHLNEDAWPIAWDR
jgi:carboxymethylenebutenolidase